MKKLYSLVRATMTSDMNIFNINQKKTKNNINMILPFLLALIFMFAVWIYAEEIFKIFGPNHLQSFALAIIVFGVSIFTIIEGVYKSSALLFDCKDDQLLLSLPISRKTVLFVRIFKFYIFELIFNSLFMIPVVISYLNWVKEVNIFFLLTSFVMLFLLPVIPIVISCLIGALIAFVSSKFKFKNLIQIIMTTMILLVTIYLSYNFDHIIDYFMKNAISLNDIISKIYYPAGVYASLADKFNLADLIIFIFINISIFILMIIVLDKIYFKINSRLKKVIMQKKVTLDNSIIKAKPMVYSLIKKELNTFIKIPVFIVNAGFGLVLFIIISIALSIRFNSIISLFSDFMSIDSIMNNISIFILMLILLTGFMTSITSSVVSLEGKNINILKALPVKPKTILMSKICAALIITTPVIVFGDVILFIRFKISIFESILLLMLSVLVPLLSHFIGLIINLKYPKLDYENSTEVVKQSVSSLVSVLIGMILLIVNLVVLNKIIGVVSADIILLVATGIYCFIDIILYLYLIRFGVNDFEKLSI